MIWDGPVVTGGGLLVAGLALLLLALGRRGPAGDRGDRAVVLVALLGLLALAVVLAPGCAEPAALPVLGAPWEASLPGGMTETVP